MIVRAARSAQCPMGGYGFLSRDDHVRAEPVNAFGRKGVLRWASRQEGEQDAGEEYGAQRSPAGMVAAAWQATLFLGVVTLAAGGVPGRQDHS